MLGGGRANKLSPKIQNWFIVGSFCLEGLYRIVWSKWLAAQIWARCINHNHPLSDASLVDDVMLHHDVANNNEIKITYL